MGRVLIKKEDALAEAYRKIGELQRKVDRLAGNTITVPITNLAPNQPPTPQVGDGTVWVEETDGSFRYRVNGNLYIVQGVQQ